MNRIYTIDGRVVTEETPHHSGETYVYWSLGYYQGAWGDRDSVLRVWRGESGQSPSMPREVDCPKNWVLV